jgi:peptidoglycan hydrolase-like protein with peptidoglycan-binding domain
VLKIICLTLALGALAWPDTATTKKKAAVKHHRAPVASHGTKTPSHVAKGASNKAVAANAKTKGKKGRRVARSSQQAPTPERYKEIQDSLASKGYFKGEANGQWGPDSDEALKRFQTDQNLMPDGKIGSLSLIALGLGPKRLSALSSPQQKPPAETAK